MPETTRTRVSFGDIQRAFPDRKGRPMTRAVLDRLLRDYPRELPEPELVGGSRIWPAEALEAFRLVIERDEHRRHGGLRS